MTENWNQEEILILWQTIKILRNSNKLVKTAVKSIWKTFIRFINKHSKTYWDFIKSEENHVRHSMAHHLVIFNKTKQCILGSICPTNYAQTSERESKAIELRDKAERVQRSDRLEDLSKKDNCWKLYPHLTKTKIIVIELL